MPLIRGNVRTVKDITDARTVLKAIANNPKFTEYGAKRLINWHKKLTSLAFAQKKNPDNSEPWAAASYKTAHDKRFKDSGGGLLTRSGDLLKAATNPEVSKSTKDGVTTANIRMPGSPFYAEFMQFGTSNIHSGSALVFVHAKTKRVETSHRRSTRTPARPFFAFASDNFSVGSDTVKEIAATTTIVFEAVRESILKRALKLPTADIEGYTSVVSFHHTATLSNRVAKSGKVVTRKARGGTAKHARLDSRKLGELYTTPGSQFHSALTESLQPPPKGPKTARTAKSARHAHYQELHRQSLAYRHTSHAEFSAREQEARTEGRSLGADKLREFNKQYNEVWALYNRARSGEERERIGLRLEEMRLKFALETGAVFRETERASQGEGRARLNELVTRYKQHREAIEKRIEASKLEETKAKHRKTLEAEHAAARAQYRALPGKLETDPFRFESALNAGELAAQHEKRQITAYVHEKLGFDIGGRPDVTEEHADRVHERALERRRQARYEKQAEAKKRPVEEIAAEAAEARVHKEQLKAALARGVQKAYEGKLIDHPTTVTAFYQSITPENRDIADAQLKKARASYGRQLYATKHGITGEKNLSEKSYRYHRGQHAAMVKRHAREAALAAEQADQAPRPAAPRNTTKSLEAPAAAEPKTPKASGGPSAPKATAAPKAPKEPAKAAPPAKLSAADKAHNESVRQSITQLHETKTHLQEAGNTEGVAFVAHQIEAMEKTLRVEKAARSTSTTPKAPAPPKAPVSSQYNRAQKTVLPHVQQRIKQLTQRAKVLSISVDELRAERNEVLSKGYKDLAADLDALAKRRHNRVTKIHKRLIPQLLHAFDALTEETLVQARSVSKNPTPKPDHTVRTEPKS